MMVRDFATGRYRIVMPHDEFMDLYHRWRQKPETKAMFARLAAERAACIDKVLADIRARQK